MPAGSKKIYNKLTLVYSHLMRNIRYDIWAEYLFNVSRKYVKKHCAVLELGSGSGLLTTHFSKYYPNIVKSDISFSMLSAMDGEINRVVCDMTILPFKENFDLVFCAFDSINYLLSELKLARLFRQVESVLKPSGVFLFDVSLEKNSFKHSKVPYSKGVYKGITYVNKSEYDPVSRVHTNFFEITENKITYKEVHKQKIFTFGTYFKIIEKTGLYPVQCYDAFTFNQGTPDCDRLQFVIKKKS